MGRNNYLVAINRQSQRLSKTGSRALGRGDYGKPLKARTGLAAHPRLPDYIADNFAETPIAKFRPCSALPEGSTRCSAQSATSSGILWQYPRARHPWRNGSRNHTALPAELQDAHIYEQPFHDSEKKGLGLHDESLRKRGFS